MDVVKAQGGNRKTGSADVAPAYIQKLDSLEGKSLESSVSSEKIVQIR